MSHDTETLDERYLGFTLVVLGALTAFGLAVLYGRGLRAAAEVEYLESIPVLDVDP